MGVIVFVAVAIVLLVGLGVFLRAVFGGDPFRGGTREKAEPGRPGPRADAHAGSQEWPGAGGLGRWNTWANGGGGGGGDGGGSNGC